MSEEKQIEEMGADICTLFRSNTMSRALASLLYDKGYRKASEIIGEIIKDLVNFADDNEKQMLINGHSVWFINADDVTDFIAELKKNYTEEGK